MTEKQKLHESVKHSLMEYRDARVKRRELLGPDLIDTIGDISKATVSAVVDKAKELKDGTVEKVSEVKDSTIQAVDKTQRNVKSFFVNLKDKMVDYAKNTVDGIKQGIEKMRGGISDFIKERRDMTTKRKQDFVEGVRSGIGNFREGLANRFDKISDALRSGQNIEQFRVEPNNDTVETTEKKQVKLKDAEDTPKEVKKLSPEETVEFVKYYLQNRDTVREAFDRLDAQKKLEPTFTDYMVASGFATFMDEMKKDDKPKAEVEQKDALSQVRQIVDLIEQTIEEKQGLTQEPKTHEKVQNMKLAPSGKPYETKGTRMKYIREFTAETDTNKRQQLVKEYRDKFEPSDIQLSTQDWKNYDREYRPDTTYDDILARETLSDVSRSYAPEVEPNTLQPEDSKIESNNKTMNTSNEVVLTEDDLSEFQNLDANLQM